MDFINTIREIYKKITSFKLNKDVFKDVNYSNSTTRRSISSAATVDFSGETNKKIREIETDVKKIVKEYFNNPEELISFIKNLQVNVYRIANAEKILEKINEEEGFFIPLYGFRAFVISNIVSIITSKKPVFSIKTNAMFIFDVKNVEIYTVARALYKYYGYKNELPGYDIKSQELYKRTCKKGKKVNSAPTGLSIDKLFACQEALKRDMESIDFTINLAVEYENSKKAAQKITDDGANI